jgi:aminopeptidase
MNRSGTHVDFMIGSNDLQVTGITPDGERIPVLRDGTWQI